MKTIINLLFFILIVFSLNAQDINNKIIDEKTGKEMLVGVCNKLALKQPPYNSWFETEYEHYEPNESVLTETKKYINENIKIVVIFGTWCGDTHEQLPRFYKTMDYIGYQPNTIELIAVDRNKEANNINIKTYKIEKIPTFIFYKNGKEIGRIIEKPSNSIENDILKILKKQ